MWDGHVNIGKRLTIYGDNAMHWGVQFYTNKFGYICFRLPFKSCGKWWPLYLYFSPNATLWASTFMIGRKHDRNEWVRSRIRYSCFGHNFDIHGINKDYRCDNYFILRGINRSVDGYCHQYWKYQRDHPVRWG